MTRIESIIRFSQSLMETYKEVKVKPDDTYSDVFQRVKDILKSIEPEQKDAFVRFILSKVSVMRWRKTAQIYNVSEELLKALPQKIPVMLKDIKLPFDNIFLSFKSPWMDWAFAGPSKIVGVYISALDAGSELLSLDPVEREDGEVGGFAIVDNRDVPPEELVHKQIFLMHVLYEDNISSTKVMPIIWFAAKDENQNATFDDIIKSSMSDVNPKERDRVEIFMRTIASFICYLSTEAPDFGIPQKRKFTLPSQNRGARKSKKKKKVIVATEQRVGFNDFEKIVETKEKLYSEKTIAHENKSRRVESFNGGHTKRPHWVRGHWRRQKCGPKDNPLYRPVWINPYGTGRLKMKGQLVNETKVRNVIGGKK